MTIRPNSDHAQHDPLLIAAHLAGDASAAEAARAEAMLQVCGECRILARDLASIAATARMLPAPARVRDFRLDPETAARLRPSGFRGRLIEGLLAPRGFGRSIASALMTLGVAGLLVTAAPRLLPLGSAASAPAQNADRVALTPDTGSAGFAAGGSASLSPEVPPAAPGGAAASDQPARTSTETSKQPGGSAPADQAAGGRETSPGEGPGGMPQPSITATDRGLDLPLPMLASAALLLVGVLLLVARRVGPRTHGRSD